MAGGIISSKKSFNLIRFFLQWEWMLVILIIAVIVVNSIISGNYASINGLMDATMVFLDKSFIVLTMVFIIIMGDIDISVASNIALSSVVMSVTHSAGVNMIASMLIGLLVGAGCGFINGILVSRFKELSAIIVTLATMSIYRGIAYVILGDQVVSDFPDWFSYFGWGYVGNTIIPFMLAAFIFFAIIFALILHKTSFGRRVFAIGNSQESSRFSGIPVERIKLIVFTLTGLMCAVSAIFLTSRLGSSRPNIAQGYELEIIAVVVLGGVSINGGKGRMLGAVLALFVIGLARYAMGLKNIPGQVMIVAIGLLLIFSVMLPNLLKKIKISKIY